MQSISIHCSSLKNMSHFSKSSSSNSQNRRIDETDLPQFQGNVSCLDVRASHSAGCWGIVLKLFHCVSYLLCPKVCWSWWWCRIIGYQEGFYLISKISPANEISSEKGPHLCTWKISSTFERLKGGPNWRALLRLFGGCLPVSLHHLTETEA